MTNNTELPGVIHRMKNDIPWSLSFSYVDHVELSWLQCSIQRHGFGNSILEQQGDEFVLL